MAGRLDGGEITSDAGAAPLREVEKRAGHTQTSGHRPPLLPVEGSGRSAVTGRYCAGSTRARADFRARPPAFRIGFGAMNGRQQHRSAKWASSKGTGCRPADRHGAMPVSHPTPRSTEAALATLGRIRLPKSSLGPATQDAPGLLLALCREGVSGIGGGSRQCRAPAPGKHPSAMIIPGARPFAAAPVRTVPQEARDCCPIREWHLRILAKLPRMRPLGCRLELR